MAELKSVLPELAKGRQGGFTGPLFLRYNAGTKENECSYSSGERRQIMLFRDITGLIEAKEIIVEAEGREHCFRGTEMECAIERFGFWRADSVEVRGRRAKVFLSRIKEEE